MTGQAHGALLDNQEAEITQFIFSEDGEHLTINPDWLDHLEASAKHLLSDMCQEA